MENFKTDDLIAAKLDETPMYATPDDNQEPIATLVAGQMLRVSSASEEGDLYVYAIMYPLDYIDEPEPVLGYVSVEQLEVLAKCPTPQSNSYCGVNLSVCYEVTPNSTQTGKRARHLNDPKMPRIEHGADPEERVTGMHRILDYLDVQKAKRYMKSGKHTYCNVYAFDYCYLAGVYIPRVWWKKNALVEIKKGNTLPVIWNNTVYELSANRLFWWLENYGEKCGWIKVDKGPNAYDALQNAANSGGVGVIVGDTGTLESGHITVVVPENAKHRAKRDQNGKVLAPLQSQAGAVNKKYFVDTKPWEKNPKFNYKRYGYWIYE